MDQATTIDKGETTYVERNWRQGAGGRVLTFAMMIEMAQSPKVAALGRDSEIVFDDKRYVVIHKEVIRKASPDLVRLVLAGAGYAAESHRAGSRQPASPASFPRIGNASHLPPRGSITPTF